MPVFNFQNIKISGIACAVPKNIVKTDSFKDQFGEAEVDKFKLMTGIQETRRTSKHQTASDLCYTAAEKLIAFKKIDKNEIGALVFGTHHPDYRRPASAFVIHKRLGLSIDTAVFDISLGCSSLIYGIQVLASMMNNSDIKKAILVLGDTGSKSTYHNDRAAIMLIGEAGVAILLEKVEENTKPIVSLLRSDGTGYRYLIVPGGGYRNIDASKEVIVCSDGNERTLHNSFMQGTSVFTFTISDIPKLIKDFWQLTNTTIDDYDCIAFHQANLYILQQIAKKLKIPAEKMPLTLSNFGNTSGASPIVTLCDKYGNIANKELNTLFCAFGVGLSWGAFSVKIDTSDIMPVIEDDTIFEEGLIQHSLEV
ncbi:MAG: ketoacyl-ACP synthase III [Saprospiraceae bacterium]|nr:ketoacyl-ACP synthase III [Saprospiraceae bacterium]